MAFDKMYYKYYDMWDKYGVKLTCRIEITKEILDQVTGKPPDVCDFIWAINAANQSNKSPAVLSRTVMDQIQIILPLLRHHNSFINKSSDYVKERANRHFRDDTEKRFKNRQPKIRNVLESYINKKSSERNNTESVADPFAQGEIPTWDELQDIYGKNAKPGENIPPDRLKKLIEDLFQKQGRKLHPNWWEETLKILRRIGK